MIDGTLHHFGACGLANGLSVLRDEESLSLWDHMTGECFDGPLAGRRLDFWPAGLTTISAELKRHPHTILLKSDYRSLRQLFMSKVAHNNNSIEGSSRFPPGFRGTMSSAIDARLPEMANGLGVIVGDEGKFYPMNALGRGESLQDSFANRPLEVERDLLDGTLFARWCDVDDAPMQLMTRWYGFSFTYPNCEIFATTNQI